MVLFSTSKQLVLTSPFIVLGIKNAGSLNSVRFYSTSDCKFTGYMDVLVMHYSRGYWDRFDSAAHPANSHYYMHKNK